MTNLLRGKVIDKTTHPKEKISNPPLEMKNKDSVGDKGKFTRGKFENKKNVKFSPSIKRLSILTE